MTNHVRGAKRTSIGDVVAFSRDARPTVDRKTHQPVTDAVQEYRIPLSHLATPFSQNAPSGGFLAPIRGLSI
jgi:hypothetical protein